MTRDIKKMGNCLRFQKSDDSSSILEIDSPVFVPWSLSFNCYFNNHSYIEISFINGKNIHTIQAMMSEYSDNVKFYEDDNMLFTAKFNFKNWTKWKIQTSKSGELKIYFDGVVFFEYYLRKFNSNLETTIKLINKYADTDTYVLMDNLSLKGNFAESTPIAK